MHNPSSLTRDETGTPAMEGQSLTHWATREVPWGCSWDQYLVG